MAQIPFQVAPPDYHENDFAAVKAIQALSRGEASSDQQTLALRWILERACMINNMSFALEGDRFTNVGEGRRFVGNQIRKLINLPIGDMQLEAKKVSKKP